MRGFEEFQVVRLMMGVECAAQHLFPSPAAGGSACPGEGLRSEARLPQSADATERPERGSARTARTRQRLVLTAACAVDAFVTIWGHAGLSPHRFHTTTAATIPSSVPAPFLVTSSAVW